MCSIGWGWCNMVEDCEFESNYIGLILKNADNNVNVINSAMLVKHRRHRIIIWQMEK